MRWLLLAIFAMFSLAHPLAAHESRPAFLDVRELSPGQYEVLWKRPMRGEYVIGFTVGWPEGCAPTVTNESQVPGASITRMLLDCGEGGLVGGTIAIDRLPETSAEVLVRVEFADGTNQTQILRPASPMMIVAGPRGALAVGTEYMILGFDHILAGIDHLVFVLGLTLIVGGGWRLVKTITAFTVAHSITLALSTLGLVRVSQAPVEAAIALSIVFLARELLLLRNGQPGLTSHAPWLVAPAAVHFLHRFCELIAIVLCASKRDAAVHLSKPARRGPNAEKRSRHWPISRSPSRPCTPPMQRAPRWRR